MDALIEGLQVTILGMGVVFFVLLILILILQLFKFFFYDRKDLNQVAPSTSKRNVIVQEKEESEDISELVIAISAVMADILDEDEAVVNIRQLN